MNRGTGLRVLRASLIVVGVLLLAGGAVLGAICSVGLMLRLALPGVLLIGAALFERWRYKRLQGIAPAPTGSPPPSGLSIQRAAGMSRSIAIPAPESAATWRHRRHVRIWQLVLRFRLTTRATTQL
jgi:hypothetical protein